MKFKICENAINKLNDDNLTVIDLEAVNELNDEFYASKINFSDDEKDYLLDLVGTIYIKSENLSIYSIAKAVVKNYDRLITMSKWEIMEEASKYNGD